MFNLKEFFNANNSSKKKPVAPPQPASTATPVQQIQTAKYGVLANNPQAQQNLIRDIQPTNYSPVQKGIDFTKSFATGLVQAPVRAATSVSATPVGYLMPGGRPQDRLEAAAQKLSNGNPDIYSAIKNQGYQDLLNQSGIGINDTKFDIGKKFVSNAAQTVALAAPLPIGQVGGAVAEKAFGSVLPWVPKVLTRAAGSAVAEAPTGAAFNLAGAVSNGDLTRQNAFSTALHGAQLGAAFGGGVPLTTGLVKAGVRQIDKSIPTVSADYSPTEPSVPPKTPLTPDNVPILPQKGSERFANTPTQDLPIMGTSLTAKTPHQIAKTYFDNKPQATADYQAHTMNEFGVNKPNIVSADSAKFLVDGGKMNPANSVPYHESASAFSKDYYKQLLNDKNTQNQPVAFTGGGSGAGKTHALTNALGDSLNKYAAIVDTNLTDIKGSITKIDQALKTGRPVEIKYVYRHPVDAFVNGVLPRAETTGRTVPIDIHADTHVGSLDTIQKLAEHYKGNTNVKIKILNNTGDVIGTHGIDFLSDKGYDKSKLTKVLHDELTQAHSQGKISTATHDATRQSTQQTGTSDAGSAEQGSQSSPRTLRNSQTNSPLGQVNTQVAPPILGANLNARENLGTAGQIPTTPEPTQLQSSQSPKIPLKPVSSSTPVIPQVASDVSNILKGQPVKERGFAETVRTAEKTPKIAAIDNGTYVVKSDTQRIADAREYIKNDPVKAEQVALNPQSDMHVTIGNQLLDHYIATGQLDKFRTLASGMAESGTELGRAIHAYADYNKTTPSGAVKFAEKTIKQYNKLNPKKQLSLSNEDVKGLVSKAQEIQKMPEGRERNIATQQLMDQVNNLIPSTIADKAITVWKAGLLTSPRTTMRNIIGNTAHGIAEIAKDIPATLNDILLKQRTGERSLTFTTKGEISGAKTGFSSGKDMMTYGFDPTHAIDKYDVRHVTWADTPVQQALKKYTDFVFHSMGAQDQPFYHGAFARSLYDQAGAAAKNAGKSGDRAFIEDMVKNPSEQMKINATKDASTATFKNENALRDVASKFKQTLGKTEAGKVISEVVAPFTGVPSSIAGQMLAYSPIGLAKGISKDVKVLSKNLPELQRQASQEIGRGVVGTGILGLGAYLTAQGLMTGNPKDANEARQWELEGKQANSVFINGKWRSVNSIGPEALVLLAGSKIQAGVADKQGAGKIAGNLGKDFTQQTFLQGVQGPLNAISDPGRYGGTYAKSQAASVIPNIVKDTAKAFDPLQRETNSVGDAIKAGVPWARNTLLPKRDALGNPLRQQPTGIGAYIDLFNSKTPVKNDVINELTRLHNNDQSATPSKLTDKTSIGGVKVDLTNKQRNDLEQRIGATTSKGFDTFVKSPQYSTLNNEQQKTVLDDYHSDIVAVEKQKFAADNSVGPYAAGAPSNAKGLTARQQKLVDGNVTIDDYLKKTKPVASPKPTKVTTTKPKTVKSTKKSTKRSSIRAKKSNFNYAKGLSSTFKTAAFNQTALRNMVKKTKIKSIKARRIKK